MKDYVPIFFDLVEVTGELNAQEKGRLIDAIVLYAQGGDWQEQIKGNERYLFPAFKKQIDRANEISENKSDAAKQREAQKAQKSAKSTEGQKIPNNNNNKEEKYNNNSEEKSVKEKAASRFTPPTVDQVRAYCKERNNGVDADAFVDFYSSKGWKVGTNPMKDWQAAVRTWEKRDNYRVAPGNAPKPPKVVNAQQYTQRVYTAADLQSASDALFEEALRDAENDL